MGIYTLRYIFHFSSRSLSIVRVHIFHAFVIVILRNVFSYLQLLLLKNNATGSAVERLVGKNNIKEA